MCQFMMTHDLYQPIVTPSPKRAARLKDGRGHVMSEAVILVSPTDRTLGYGEKMEVHRRGLRHRAFSVFLVDETGRLLLQRRHPDKYHSGGLWANSCCGHPRPKERINRAAERRTFEELGVRSNLRPVFQTSYAAEFPNGMTENEVVTVFFGRLEAVLDPHPLEVIETAFLTPQEVAEGIKKKPARHTYWLRHYFEQHLPVIEETAKAASGWNAAKQVPPLAKASC